jgi:hypothetical protein
MKSIFQIVAILAISVFVATMWHDGGAAAQSLKDLLGWAGGVAQEAVDHFSTFVQNF